MNVSRGETHHQRRTRWLRPWGLAAIVAGALVLTGPGAVGQEPAIPPASAAPAVGPAPLPFAGTWSATGTRQVLAMGPGRKAAIFYLSGSLILTSQEGLSLGFRSEAIGFDGADGVSVGECVWTDDQGDQIFSKVEGWSIRTGRHVVSTITGGTGRYAGITGEYEFDWQYVVQVPGGTFQVRAVGLKGVVRPRGPVPQEGPK